MVSLGIFRYGYGFTGTLVCSLTCVAEVLRETPPYCSLDQSAWSVVHLQLVLWLGPPSVWGPPWGVPGLPGGSGDSLRCLLISVLLWLLFLLGKLSDLSDLGVFLRSICCTFTADKWTKDFHAVLADSCSMGGKPGLLRIVFWCGFPSACVLLCVFHINSAQVSC